MGRYILRRFLLLIPVIIGVSLMIFVMINLAPGSILDIMGEDMTPEQRAIKEHEMGLDKPILVRYGLYMADLVRGDLGYSYLYHENVWTMYMQRIPHTIKLAFASMAVCICLAIPLGISAAKHRGSLYDNTCSVLSLLGLSIPNFWLGLMLTVLFSLKLGWLPAYGDKQGIKSILMPAFTLGTGMMATIARTTRSSMLDVLNQDYLRTARSKGVSEKQVVKKHAFRNALIPIVTVVGSQLGHSFGGAVVTENVFAWPGVGQILIAAIKGRDTILVCGTLIASTTLICIVQLLVDISYAFIDPRLKGQFASKKRAPKAKGVVA